MQVTEYTSQAISIMVTTSLGWIYVKGADVLTLYRSAKFQRDLRTSGRMQPSWKQGLRAWLFTALPTMIGVVCLELALVFSTYIAKRCIPETAMSCLWLLAVEGARLLILTVSVYRIADETHITIVQISQYSLGIDAMAMACKYATSALSNDLHYILLNIILLFLSRGILILGVRAFQWKLQASLRCLYSSTSRFNISATALEAEHERILVHRRRFATVVIFLLFDLIGRPVVVLLSMTVPLIVAQSRVDSLQSDITANKLIKLGTPICIVECLAGIASILYLSVLGLDWSVLGQLAEPRVALASACGFSANFIPQVYLWGLVFA
jgi:hypothetical protein